MQVRAVFDFDPHSERELKFSKVRDVWLTVACSTLPTYSAVVAMVYEVNLVVAHMQNLYIEYDSTALCIVHVQCTCMYM